MDVVAPPPPPRLGPPPSALLVGLVGLLLPGLGHVVAGRPGKGFFYFCLVGLAFTAGLWMTGLVAVQPDRDPLWFAGQALAGLPTLAVWKATEGLVATERLASFDLGMLYTAVAGLLNVVAIADALGIVDDARAVADLRRRADAAAQAARGAEHAAAADEDGFAAASRALGADGPRVEVAPVPADPAQASRFLADSALAAPDLTAPDLAAPDLAAPDRTAPDLTAPDLTAPDRTTTEVAESGPIVGGPLP